MLDAGGATEIYTWAWAWVIAPRGATLSTPTSIALPEKTALRVIKSSSPRPGLLEHMTTTARLEPGAWTVRRAGGSFLQESGPHCHI